MSTASYRFCTVKLKAGKACIRAGRFGRMRVQFDLKLTLAHQGRQSRRNYTPGPCSSFRYCCCWASAAAYGVAAGGPLQQLLLLLLILVLADGS